MGNKEIPYLIEQFKKRAAAKKAQTVKAAAGGTK
jgi:hypothetical protein